MDTKLTLKLDANIIKKAKLHARNHGVSLSKIIESYLDSITRQQSDNNSDIAAPLSDSLSGIITLQDDFDYKKEYGSHLTKKYS